MRDEMEDAREEREGTACLLPVFIYISQHFQLVAVCLQRDKERERFAPGHCGLVMASLSLSLKVFANIKSVCFGLKQGRSSWFVTYTYFTGYYYKKTSSTL